MLRTPLFKFGTNSFIAIVMSIMKYELSFFGVVDNLTTYKSDHSLLPTEHFSPQPTAYKPTPFDLLPTHAIKILLSCSPTHPAYLILQVTDMYTSVPGCKFTSPSVRSQQLLAESERYKLHKLVAGFLGQPGTGDRLQSSSILRLLEQHTNSANVRFSCQVCEQGRRLG